MPLLVGLCLIPVALVMSSRVNSVKSSKKTKLWLNLSLVALVILYFVFILAVNKAPFEFEINYSLEYSLYSGDYIVYFSVVLIFTPFVWIVIIHFLRRIIHRFKISKKAIIRKSQDLQYYRDDLDKISPSTIMFAASLELDDRRSIAATILKLKMMGYIKEENGVLYCITDKLDALSESEKMVHGLVLNSTIDIKAYRKAVVDETLKDKYLKKNIGGAFVRILKIVIAVALTFGVFKFSFWIDQYVHENYWVYPGDDGKAYYALANEKDIQELFKEIEDDNHYYHYVYGDGEVSYYWDTIRVTCMQYKIVRKAFFMNLLGLISIPLFIIMAFATLGYFLINVKNITKNYRYTAKGRELVTKAYALKNYLEDFSMIRERKEEELALWEYYLIYAVALGVNEELDDVVMEKYVRYINIERNVPYDQAK